MTIHREGNKLLIYLLVILVVVNAAVYHFFPAHQNLQLGCYIASFVLYILILQFFRSPKRVTPLNDKHVIAPADGEVVVIEEVLETEYFNDRRRQISIFMSPLNVHINRNPISGIVAYFKYHPGKYLVAWHPKSSTENERTTIVVQKSEKQVVLFRQIAGALARRILCYVKTGDTVKQGEEFGFIKFGSRVDIFLPLSAKINVKIGDKPVGGETVIAEFAD